VNIGIFGALWGAIETTVGAPLHVLRVPFTGTLLTAVGITIALIGRLFVPRGGSVLFIGLVTAFLKMLSLGGIVLNPMIGIVIESSLAELALTGLGKARRASFTIAGGAATAWCFFQPFLTQAVLAGRELSTVYRWTVENGAGLLGLKEDAAVLIVAVLTAGHVLVGAAAGFLAWDLGRTVQSRLSPSPDDVEAS